MGRLERRVHTSARSGQATEVGPDDTKEENAHDPMTRPKSRSRVVTKAVPVPPLYRYGGLVAGVPGMAHPKRQPRRATDRLIGRYLPSIVPLVPRIGGSPVVPTAGFLLADAMLVALSVWDWRANKRFVFPIALLVLVAYHTSVLTFYQFAFWRAFGEWFMTLPLS
jgi:hypothetical protein